MAMHKRARAVRRIRRSSVVLQLSPAAKTQTENKTGWQEAKGHNYKLHNTNKIGSDPGPASPEPQTEPPGGPDLSGVQCSPYAFLRIRDVKPSQIGQNKNAQSDQNLRRCWSLQAETLVNSERMLKTVGRATV